MQPAHWLAASAESLGITSALFQSIYMADVVISGAKNESDVTLYTFRAGLGERPSLLAFRGYPAWRNSFRVSHCNRSK